MRRHKLLILITSIVLAVAAVVTFAANAAARRAALSPNPGAATMTGRYSSGTSHGTGQAAAGAKGSAKPRVKRMSHLRIVLTDGKSN